MPIKLICAARTHEDSPDFDRVAEVAFDSFQALVRALDPAAPGRAFSDAVFGSEVDKIIVLAEAENLPLAAPVNAGAADSALATATATAASAAAAAAMKSVQVLYFLARDAEIYPEDFEAWWLSAHERALDHAVSARRALARCQVNRRRRVSDNDAALRRRFGRIGAGVHELVVSLRFGAAGEMEPFQQYHQALLRYTPAFVDASQSFFVLTE